jgi:hypothetical protein
MAAAELRYLHRSPQCSVATFREVSIFVVHTELTVEALRASVTAYHELRARHPGSVLSVTLSAPGALIPPPDARNEASRAMVECQDQTRCTAVVIQGEGFYFSTMRSVLTAINMVRPYKVPMRVFAELPTAVHWAGSHLDRHDATWDDEVLAAVRRTAQPSDVRQLANRDA